MLFHTAQCTFHFVQPSLQIIIIPMSCSIRHQLCFFFMAVMYKPYSEKVRPQLIELIQISCSAAQSFASHSQPGQSSRLTGVSEPPT